ncbi:hypothetical protein EGW08_017964 [Elysia chlorotica]|uniref:Uncharacterized protein n=1 Tax=Elysia chlorotica TaxID=188477 RepID=A0A433SY91_ELYCH|nr:hypothetical protein EGW08_017964 [Elysia chlorotica]
MINSKEYFYVFSRFFFFYFEKTLFAATTIFFLNLFFFLNIQIDGYVVKLMLECEYFLEIKKNSPYSICILHFFFSVNLDSFKMLKRKGKKSRHYFFALLKLYFAT